MPKREVDVVLVALSTPLLVGVYENGVLIEELESQQRSSEVLPSIYKELLGKYNIKTLIYANGPGSFMSIKVAYIFLKSLSILKDIPLMSVDAFYFNGGRPIKAIGKLHFVKIHDKIETRKFDGVEKTAFKLPRYLHKEDFSEETAPMYGIAAV